MVSRPRNDSESVARVTMGPLISAPGLAATQADCVVVEDPLEIRLDCNPLAVTMRTPGADAQLALGFLLSEGIIAGRNQVRDVVLGGEAADGAAQLVNVLLTPDALANPAVLAAARRGTLTTSSCGVCGRQSIDDLRARCQPFAATSSLDASVVWRSVQALRPHQPIFASTGGLHAAAVFDQRGELLVCCEDIGRHNAVDKVVGSLLQAGIVPHEGDAPLLLVVSGRASFEIVQKAAMARIAVVASVSSASSLAVELAQALQMTLIAFVRGQNGNVYAGFERIR